MNTKVGKRHKKTALVVGGTEGFGLAVTRALIRKGFLVATISRTSENNDGVDQFHCDVTDTEELKKTLVAIRHKYYYLDVIACIVGWAKVVRRIDTLSGKDWLRHMRRNFTYVDLVFRTLGTSLKYTEHPVGITIGSRFAHGDIGDDSMLPYICSKHALRVLTQDIAEKNRDLSINNYCVVPMDTPGRREVFGSDEGSMILADPKTIAESIVKHALSRVKTGKTLFVNDKGTIDFV